MINNTDNNYAFIDANNLHLGSVSDGINVNYSRLRIYLHNRFQVKKAYIFIGYDPEHKKLYQRLRRCGFDLVFKPTVSINKSGKKVLKGNVDAELVLWSAAREIANYDKAVIITGDGDFACLIQYLIEQGKFRRLITPSHKFSTLLKKYAAHITTLSSIRTKIS